MKNKKKYVMLTLAAVISFILITVGVTYSFFAYIKEGTTDNTIKAGSISFIYEEVNKMGNGIKIEDALPTSDTEGKASTNYFDFKVTSSTASTIAIPYEITARKDKNSDNLDEYVKIYLTKVDGNEEEEKVLSMFNNLEDTEQVLKQGTEKTLYKSEIPVGVTNYTDNYRLRMWLNDNKEDGSVLDYSGTMVCRDNTYTTKEECESNGSDWISSQEYLNQNKTFKITINVYANGKSLTSNELQNTNITNITVNGNSLTEVTDEVYNYELIVDKDTDKANFEVETEVEGATVKIEKTDSTFENVLAMNGIQKLSTKKTLPLKTGDNYFKVTVTSLDKKEESITKIKISVKDAIKIFGKTYEISGEGVSLDKKSSEANENGLYVSHDTNSGEPTYFFRGNVDNNNVKFAGYDWKIVRVNEDGSIRLMMNTGINNDAVYAFSGSQGSNTTTMYYSNTGVSGAWYRLHTWYDTYIGDSTMLGSIVEQEADFCEAFDFSGTFKCENDSYNHSIIKTNIGLITANEARMAGIGPTKTTSTTYSNTQYYLYTGRNYWTMTPAGPYNSEALEHLLVCSGGCLYNRFTRYTGEKPIMRPVINIKADTSVLGEGTMDDPLIPIAIPINDIVMKGIDNPLPNKISINNEEYDITYKLNDIQITNLDKLDEGEYSLECNITKDGVEVITVDRKVIVYHVPPTTTELLKYPIILKNADDTMLNSIIGNNELTNIILNDNKYIEILDNKNPIISTDTSKVFASSEYTGCANNGCVAIKAFDTSASSYWSVGAGKSYKNQYLGYDFGEPVWVYKMLINMSNGKQNTDYVLEASNDNVNYTILKDGLHQGGGEISVIPNNYNQKYRYYRIRLLSEIAQSGNGNTVVSNLKFYAK